MFGASSGVNSHEELVEVRHEFDSVDFESWLGDEGKLELRIRSEGPTRSDPISVLVTPLRDLARFRLVMAMVVLIGLYVLIIFEVCDRSLAAMLGEFTLTIFFCNSSKSNPSNCVSMELTDSI